MKIAGFAVPVSLAGPASSADPKDQVEVCEPVRRPRDVVAVQRSTQLHQLADEVFRRFESLNCPPAVAAMLSGRGHDLLRDSLRDLQAVAGRRIVTDNGKVLSAEEVLQDFRDNNENDPPLFVTADGLRPYPLERFSDLLILDALHVGKAPDKWRESPCMRSLQGLQEAGFGFKIPFEAEMEPVDALGAFRFTMKLNKGFPWYVRMETPAGKLLIETDDPPESRHLLQLLDDAHHPGVYASVRKLTDAGIDLGYVEYPNEMVRRDMGIGRDGAGINELVKLYPGYGYTLMVKPSELTDADGLIMRATKLRELHQRFLRDNPQAANTFGWHGQLPQPVPPADGHSRNELLERLLRALEWDKSRQGSAQSEAGEALQWLTQELPDSPHLEEDLAAGTDILTDRRMVTTPWAQRRTVAREALQFANRELAALTVAGQEDAMRRAWFNLVCGTGSASGAAKALDLMAVNSATGTLPVEHVHAHARILEVEGKNADRAWTAIAASRQEGESLPEAALHFLALRDSLELRGQGEQAVSVLEKLLEIVRQGGRMDVRDTIAAFLTSFVMNGDWQASLMRAQEVATAPPRAAAEVVREQHVVKLGGITVPRRLG